MRSGFSSQPKYQTAAGIARTSMSRTRMRTGTFLGTGVHRTRWARTELHHAADPVGAVEELMVVLAGGELDPAAAPATLGHALAQRPAADVRRVVLEHVLHVRWLVDEQAPGTGVGLDLLEGATEV